MARAESDWTTFVALLQAGEQRRALDAENKTEEAPRPRVSANQAPPQSGQCMVGSQSGSVWLLEHSPCPPEATHKRKDLTAPEHLWTNASVGVCKLRMLLVNACQHIVRFVGKN